MNRFEVLSKGPKLLIKSLFAVTSLFARIIRALFVVFLETISLGVLVAYRALFTDDKVTFGWVKEVGFFHRSPRYVLTDYAILDPYLGFRLEPNGRMESWDSLTGELNGYLQVNKYGYVKNNDDVSDDEAIDPEHFIIVVTGGSTAAGNGVPKNSLIFSGVLERRLNAYAPEGLVLRRPVRVINAGVPGYNSSQEIIYMVFDLAYLEPEVWVMFNGINERWMGEVFEGATDWHHNQDVVGRLKRHDSSGFRISMGDFLPATRLLVERVKIRLKPEIYNETVRPGYLNNKLLLRPGAERYSRNIEISAAIASSQNIGFIYALQPTSGAGSHPFTQEEVAARQNEWSEDRWQQYQQIGNRFYDEFESEMEKLRLQLEDNPLIALTSMRHIFDQVDERVYADPRHYTEIGNRIIADHLFNIIVDRFAEELYEPATGS